MKTALTLFCLITFLPLAPSGEPARVDAQPVRREHFTFYFDNPRYVDAADSVLTRARHRLVDLLDDSLSYKPSIYLVADQPQFNKLIRGRFPDWGAAAAFPERKLIAIKSPDHFNLGKSLEELLVHEYSHLVVSHKTGFHEAPRWLHEGISVFVSMEWSFSDNLAMNRAAIFGDFLALREIENLNRFSEGKAHVAYAHSYLAVNYIYDNYGRRALPLLLAEHHVVLGRSGGGGGDRDLHSPSKKKAVLQAVGGGREIALDRLRLRRSRSSGADRRR
jgi:hypothetical protein